MEFELVPVRGQKFDVGRTINPLVCDRITEYECSARGSDLQMERDRYKSK